MLKKDEASPIAPESDEEGDGGATDDARRARSKKTKKNEPAEVRIDFDGIDQRIVALPIDRANCVSLDVAAGGALFLAAAPDRADRRGLRRARGDDDIPRTVYRYDSKKRKTEKFVDKRHWAPFQVSADGKKVLYAEGEQWFIVDADKPPKDGDGKVDVDGVQVWVDPRAEWRQMYHEVWRIERDFLYDPHAHGLDLATAEKIYAPFLDGDRGARRSQRALRRDALEPRARSRVGAGRNVPAAGSRERRPARRRLHHRERALPHSRASSRARTGTRKLARAAHAARRRREGGRLSARRQRRRAPRRRRRGPALPRSRGQADGDHGRPETRSARTRARGHRRAGGRRRIAAPAHVDGGQPQEGRPSCRRDASATCTSPTRTAGASRTSTATTSPRSARTPSSSTSASTTAATSPTTS